MSEPPPNDAASSTQEVSIKLAAAADIIERLKQQTVKRDPQEQRLLSECDQWLARARRALETSRWWRTFFALDAAYTALHQVRHLLCEILPLERLHTLAQEILFDLPYVPDDGERERRRRALESIIACLDPAHLLRDTEGNEIPEAGLRQHLVRESMAIAHHREAVWHKVNLFRTRLLTTLAVLVVLLAGSIVLVPAIVDAAGKEQGSSLRWYLIVALQVFGALGGALSALLAREPLHLPVGQYYLKQAVLYLRPAVGAAAGLVLGLLHLSGAVSVFPGAGEDWKWVVALLVAFVGGFSERLFLGRLDRVLGQRDEEPDQGDSPPRPEKASEKPEPAAKRARADRKK